MNLLSISILSEMLFFLISLLLQQNGEFVSSASKESTFYAVKYYTILQQDQFHNLQHLQQHLQQAVGPKPELVFKEIADRHASLGFVAEAVGAYLQKVTYAMNKANWYKIYAFYSSLFCF